MYRYAAKRTSRNKKLFLAILVGVMIATTLFAASNIGANSLMGAMLVDILDDVPVDMTWYMWSWGEIPDPSTFFEIRQEIEQFSEVSSTELVVQHSNASWEDLQYQYTTGIQHNSTVYDGMTLVSGNMSLGANETLIATSSAMINDFPVGSNYSITVMIWRQIAEPIIYNLTLKVIGHVDLTPLARDILIAGSYLPYYGYEYESWLTQHVSLFIVDVETTFLPIYYYARNQTDVDGIDLEQRINIYVDRASLINPYNIQQTATNIQRLGNQIMNALSYQYEGYLSNALAFALQIFSYISENFRMVFLQVSIPVFFIALYMGVTLNDVSYSIRRREIGLLLTKGVTRSTITSLFVWEALLIGLLASILGILVGFAIIPFFIPAVTWASMLTTGIGFDTIFITIIFGVILAVFASYLPARKAAKISTVDAIKEYTLAGESTSSSGLTSMRTSYPRMLAWTALILGCYKLVIWLLGINVSEILLDVIFTNPIMASLVAYWVIFDAFITFWAPLLFLWGLTTIIIKGWPSFYRYLERFISRILGELGGLASHNISRRPARTAAIIFITALLVGYGVQTIGILGTSQDLAIRDAYTQVGADLDVIVSLPENVSDLLPTIRSIEGVRGAAGQFTFTISRIEGNIDVRAINVSDWLGVAYWEQTWILGVPAMVAFDALAANNDTIILEKIHAMLFNLNIGNQISVQFSPSGTYYPLTIVGYMGPEPKLVQDPWGWGSQWQAEETWSYVPVELMEEHSSEISSSTGHILVSLDSPAYNMEVIQAIQALEDVVNVESAPTRIEEYNANVLLSSTTNMMQLGVAFSFLLASIGTLVIIFLTLRERRTTTALMSARGMTYSQTVIILMAEILTMIVFAITIGFIVGVIIYYGLVSSGTVTYIPQLLTPLFFPPAFLIPIALQVGTMVGLLILTTIVPILIEARVARYDLSVLR
ncbi:MAG: ABC transporter permease [Promethearchaeota archaeon]